MIWQITRDTDFSVSLLLPTWRGKRMYSHYKAYGLGYSFCQFFGIDEDGMLLRINDTILVCLGEASESQCEEIASFIQMHMPHRVECSASVREKIILRLVGYQALHRTMFELCDNPTIGDIPSEEEDIEFHPSLAEVYHILSEGFPHLQDYALWLTDTSHRIRHGVSLTLLYRHNTTASILYDIEDTVLIGQVATLPEARGQGAARLFLQWIARYLAVHGKRAILYALDVRESFYREIGFRAIESEYVLERESDRDENPQKGQLM